MYPLPSSLKFSIHKISCDYYCLILCLANREKNITTTTKINNILCMCVFLFLICIRWWSISWWCLCIVDDHIIVPNGNRCSLYTNKSLNFKCHTFAHKNIFHNNFIWCICGYSHNDCFWCLCSYQKVLFFKLIIIIIITFALYKSPTITKKSHTKKHRYISHFKKTSNCIRLTDSMIQIPDI